MGMFDKLLGKRATSPAKAQNSRPTAPNSVQFEASQQLPQSVGSVRKDLLRLVLRELLTRNGIPQSWLSADMLRTTSSKREQGLHVRFLLRHWEPRLMEHGPAFEQEFTQRLLVLDPGARDWLSGFSWQFALQDTGACRAMPRPGSWTAPAAQQERPAEGAPLTKPGDIIEGPVHIPRTTDEMRADLEQLLALRDVDLKRQGKGGEHFAATRPASL
jgi:hypothetical protein